MSKSRRGQPGSSGGGQTPRRSSRRRRRVRLAVYTALALCLLVVCAGYLISRSGVLRAVLEPRLAEAIGAEVISRDVSLGLSGRLVARDLELSVADVDGPAGEFLQVSRVVVQLNWGEVFRGLIGRGGERAIRSVRFDEPTVRLSQSVDDGSFNIAALLDRPDGPGVAPTVIPEISIRDGLIIFGEHGAGEFLPQMEMRVTGRLYAQDPVRGLHAIELAQIDPDDDSPLRMVGGIDLKAGSAWLDMFDVDLADWSMGAPTAEGRALWRRLAISGDVPRASLRYDDSGVSAEFELAGVDLTTPIPSQVQLEGPSLNEWLRVLNAYGVIRFDSDGLHANLTGLLEDLPIRMQLDTEGLGLTSALHCEITVDRYAMSDQPDFLPFTPRAVREYFKDFSAPTADVTASMTLSRAAPVGDSAAPLRVRGEFKFENGVSAHKAFAYVFHELDGVISFDEDGRIELVGITGVARSGARLRADGWIQTGGGDAEIIIAAEAIPVDDTLLDAMPDAHRFIIEAARDREALSRLHDAGIIQTRRMREEAQRRLNSVAHDLDTLRREGGTASRRIALERAVEELEASVATPVFELGGRADAVVTLSRGAGERMGTDVKARFGSLDLLPAASPYPLRAHDLRLTIQGEAAQFSSARLEGMSGAAGSMEGAIGLLDTPEATPRTEISATLKGTPIDALLLTAIPSPTPGEDAGESPAELVRALGLRGAVDVRIGVESEAGGEIGHTIEATFTDLAAAPGPVDPARRPADLLSKISGSINLNSDRLLVGPLTASIGDAGLIEFELVRSFVGAEDLHSVARLVGVDVERPIEDLLAPLATDAAARIAEIRAAYTPAGLIDALVRMEGGAGRSLEARVELRDARSLSFDSPGGRVELSRRGGGAIVTDRSIFFDEFECDLVFGGARSGSLGFDGAVALDGESPTDLRMRLHDSRFELPLVRMLIDRFVPDDLAETLAQYDPRGGFDAALRVVGETLDSVSIAGTVAPRSLSLVSNEGRIEIPGVSGRIEFDQEGGRIESLVFESQDWTWSADGHWRLDEAGPSIELHLAATGSGLGDDLRSLLPEDARLALASIDIVGGYELRDATLRYGAFESGEENGADPGALSFGGHVFFNGASYLGEFPISDVRGSARIDSRRASADEPTRVYVDVTADQLLFADMLITGVRAEIVAGATPGLTEVRNFSGTWYGGRIVASAVVWSEAIGGSIALVDVMGGVALTPTGESRTRYEVDVRSVGVDFGRLTAGRGSSGAEATGAEEGGGRLDGELSVSGVVGDPDSARGRGLVRVEGGRFARLPLLMSILEVSNLQPPRGESLQGAEAHFFILGRRANFDTLFARSNSITVAGRGSASWPELRLDLRFRTSGNIRVPFVSDLVDALRNELLTITVSGSLDSPRFGVTQLPATSDFLREVFQTERPRRRQGEATPSARP